MNFVFNLDGVICTPPKGIQFGIVAGLFEEWKKEWKNDRQHEQRSGDTR